MMNKNLLYIFLLLSVFPVTIHSQEVLEIQPLFEYPVAPDELESLEERCNYIVNNFWKDFDFKKTTPVDQYALNDAFQVYVSAFPFAGIKEVDQSISLLLKNLSGNPTYLMQFTKAAQANLYAPRADFWSDEIFLDFIDALAKNKKIPEARKSNYLKMAQAIRESKPGNTAPSFWFIDPENGSKQYFPMSTPTMLIFGNPDNTDWRLARLRMESNFQLSDALQKGKVNILYIVPTETSNWKEEVSNYNKYWKVGQSNDANIHYDLKLDPEIYVVGSDGKIIEKNLLPQEAIAVLLHTLE